MFFRTFMLAASVAIVAAAPATAQSNQPRPLVDCQATPAPNANQGNDAAPSGGVDPAQTGSVFIDKLTPCDGVLKPPATGDEMTQPPPETGTMREIRPGELPDQQSSPQQQ
jgi:hypothetical protein